MSESAYNIPITDIIRTEGNSLILKVGEFLLTLKIEGPEPKTSGRLRLGQGRTMFDLVLNAAMTFIKETGEREFSAANLYHIAVARQQELGFRRNNRNSHVVSSAPNHQSYKHYTSHRDYFRYLGSGKYSINPSVLP